jgi:hypothetical protein
MTTFPFNSYNTKFLREPAAVACRDWLAGPQCHELIRDISSRVSFENVKELLEYPDGYAGSDKKTTPPKVDYATSWQSIAEHVVLGLYRIESTATDTIRMDIVGTVIQHEWATKSTKTKHASTDPPKGGDHISKVRSELHEFILSLAKAHAQINQQVIMQAIREVVGSDTYTPKRMVLRRTIHNKWKKNRTLESWSYYGSGKTFGDHTKLFAIPINHILSIGSWEGEIIVSQVPLTGHWMRSRQIRFPYVWRMLACKNHLFDTWVPTDLLAMMH